MWKPLLYGFLGALLAVALALVGLHTYHDHRNWHQLVNLLEAQQQQPAKAPPAAEPAK